MCGIVEYIVTQIEIMGEEVYYTLERVKEIIAKYQPIVGLSYRIGDEDVEVTGLEGVKSKEGYQIYVASKTPHYHRLAFVLSLTNWAVDIAEGRL